MNVPVLTSKSAWLPVTPRGVAAFALARTGRLLLIQFFIAVIAAAIVGWFLRAAWIPTIREAIRQSPDGAQIQSGELKWPAHSPVALAEGHFLGIGVDLEHSGQNGGASHLQFDLGRHDWQVSSLLGVLDAPSWVNTTYPTGATVTLGRTELEPWWGAREPFLIMMAMAGVVVWLMATWAALGLFYSVPVWLVGFFANRSLDWRGSWRLAGAALMPGALMLSAAIVLYGLRVFDVMKLGLAFGLHLLVGWLYLFVSPLFLPRDPEAPPGLRNPFASGK